MSWQATDWAATKVTGIDAASKALLMILAHHADLNGENCHPGAATLEKEACQSRTRVFKSIAELEAAGIIRVTRSRKGKQCGVNHYHLPLGKTLPGTKKHTVEKVEPCREDVAIGSPGEHTWSPMGTTSLGSNPVLDGDYLVRDEHYLVRDEHYPSVHGHTVTFPEPSINHPINIHSDSKLSACIEADACTLTTVSRSASLLTAGSKEEAPQGMRKPPKLYPSTASLFGGDEEEDAPALEPNAAPADRPEAVDSDACAGHRPDRAMVAAAEKAGFDPDEIGDLIVERCGDLVERMKAGEVTARKRFRTLWFALCQGKLEDWERQL
jgi:hypothetical protein